MKPGAFGAEQVSNDGRFGSTAIARELLACMALGIDSAGI